MSVAMNPEQDGLADQIKLDQVGQFQLLILLLGTLVLFCDGFDAQMMSFVAPALAKDRSLVSTEVGQIFAANLAGLMIGAAMCAPIADIVSRRLTVIVCVALFGISTLLVPIVPSVKMLSVLRFITGLSMGAAMPAMIAMASEFLPRRLRTRLVVLLSCSFSLGTVVCGAIAGLLIQEYGWRAMFWIGGVLPLVTVAALLAALPESPRYLALQNRREDLTRLVARLAPGTAFDARTVQAPSRQRHFPVRELFKDGRAPLTLLLSLTFFLYGSSLYFLINWLPTLVTKSGFSVAQGGAVTASYQFGGLLGGFLIGYLVDRAGLRMLIVSTFAACVAVALAGVVTQSLAAIFVAAFVVGLFVIGNQHTINALAGSSLYPNALRATGLGWSLGSVRLGGVLAGSLGAGLLLKAELPISSTFAIIAFGELLAGLALIALYFVYGKQSRSWMQVGAAATDLDDASGVSARPLS